MTTTPPDATGPETAATTGSQPVGELVKQASEQISLLVRQELRLAVAEIKDKGRHAGIGAGLVGGAGLVAAYGVAAVLVAVTAALALVLPLWAAALIVGAVLLAVSAGMAMTGRGQISQALPPVPEQAIDSTQQDVAEIKERAHR